MRLDVRNELDKFIRKDMGLLNKSEIARRLGCNRRTVSRYMEEVDVGVEKKRDYTSMIDDYKVIIIDKVDTYGATAMAVFKFIQKKGYKGEYGIIAKYVREHKAAQNQKATIRFETAPGLQAQIDWKEQVTMVNKYGEVFVINIFLMVLGYSRRKFIKLTVDKVQKTLFVCMFEAFKFYQGIPHEILFDNMATVIDRQKSTFKSVQINQTFKHFSLDAGFTPILCRPYRPKTKGKVESLAKLVDRLKVYNGEFETYEDLDKITVDFMNEINEEVSQATGEVPNERFVAEREYLCAIASMDCLKAYFLCEKEYKISHESMVTYKGQKYSVPTKYIRQHVTITEDEDSIQIYYSKDLLACHPKSIKKLNYTHEHAREILKSDAFKHFTDDQIDKFINKNLSHMDMLLESN